MASSSDDIDAMDSGGGKIDLGFTMRPWLEKTLSELEEMPHGQEQGIFLPTEIDPRYFVAKLGEPERDVEFGGFYDPASRFTELKKGFPPRSGQYITWVTLPNPNKWENIDAVILHTHPFHPNIGILSYRDPQNACRPSEGSLEEIGDIGQLMQRQRVLLEQGINRPVTMFLGSGGYMSVSTAEEIKFDGERLLSAGCDQRQVMAVKEIFALAPPVWAKNFARKGREGPLVSLLNEFYAGCQSKGFRGFLESLDAFAAGDQFGVETDRRADLKTALSRHLPRYPTETYLGNLGMGKDQISLVLQMSGVQIKVYQVQEGIGLVLR